MVETFFESVKEWSDAILGTEAKDLKLWQTILRALILYVFALIIIRVGKKRIFGRNTAFDIIMGIVIGSVFSRAVNGNAPFWGTITGAAALVGMHWLFAAIAFRKPSFGSLIKGHSDVLIKEGEIQWEKMKEHDLSEKDLQEAMRLDASTTQIGDIKLATLERNGNISFIKQDKTQEKKPKVVELQVKEGIQTIRIEIN